MEPVLHIGYSRELEIRTITTHATHLKYHKGNGKQEGIGVFCFIKSSIQGYKGSVESDRTITISYNFSNPIM